MPTPEDVELGAARLGAWSEALGGLSDPAACRKLLAVLDKADGRALQKLVDDWRFPRPAECLDIVETITRFVHTGDYRPVETRSVVNMLRPPSPSRTTGRGCRLRDGSLLWLTEAEWWEMFDQAVSDPAPQEPGPGGGRRHPAMHVRLGPHHHATTSTSATRSAPPRGTRMRETP